MSAAQAALIDGKAIAARLRASLKLAVGRLPTPPGLATLLVGDNPASALYVNNKLKACAEVGIHGRLLKLPADVSEARLFDEIEKLNNDAAIDGILLQLPLPRPLDEQQFLSSIDPAKDVDGLGPVNYGLLAAGLPAHIPCTPLGCLKLIHSVKASLAGMHAVVIGRSRLVGRPMAELLLQQNCTVTVVHSQTIDPAALVQKADIVVVAAGRPALVKANWIKPGAIVIDVGINRVDGRLVGDVDFAEVQKVAGAITPVPGGVGPMTVAMLLNNTVRSAYAKAGLRLPEEMAA